MIFRDCSTSGRAFNTAAGADDIRFLGEADEDRTDTVRDHFLSLCRAVRISDARLTYYACGRGGFNIPVVARN
jgi:hypothetical protein